MSTGAMPVVLTDTSGGGQAAPATGLVLAGFLGLSPADRANALGDLASVRVTPTGGTQAALGDSLASLAAGIAQNADKIATVLAGTDPSLDTFLEAYTRFLADESTAAAMQTAIGNLVTAVAAKASKGVNSDITDLLGPNGTGIRFRGASTTLASAATVDLGNVPTRKVAISGTTAITSFGTVPHAEVLVRFSGVLTLTHDATALVLPGASSIVTAAGDTAVFTSDASGNWTCRHYQRTTGKALIPPSRSDIGAAASGPNSDITSLSGLTYPFAPVLASIAALRAYPYALLTSGTAARVAAYYAGGTLGGGFFLWSTTSTASDDGGLTIAPTGITGAGRWLRSVPGDVWVTMFGAKVDGATNDYAAFQAAAALGRTIRIPAGWAKINGTIIPTHGTQFIGAGRPAQYQYNSPSMAGTVLDFAGAPAGSNGFTNATSTAATTTAFADANASINLSVTSNTGIALGQIITGTGIPANTLVIGISGQALTLSQAVTVTTGTALTFLANSALQMFRLADLQVERAPAHGVFMSAVYAEFDRVSFAYNGNDGLSLHDSYLVRVSRALFEKNNGNGFTDFATGTYTTLQLDNNESLYNGGDGYSFTNINSTAVIGGGADSNTGCGYRITNSNIGFYSTDSESNGLSGYAILSNSNAAFVAATAAANNKSGTANETNFAKFIGSKGSFTNSYDLAPLSGVSSIIGLQSSQIILSQTPTKASVAVDATSYLGSPAAPGSAPGSVQVGNGNSATGTNAVAVGYLNTTAGAVSAALGSSNVITGAGSVGVGAGGKDYGAKNVIAFGYGAPGGVNRYLLRATSTATTAVRLTSDGAAATAATSIPIQTGTSNAINGVLTARDDSTGDVITYNLVGALVYRGSGNVALAGAGTWTRGALTSGFSSQTAPTLTVDTTNQCINLSVTPINGDTIQWYANLEVTTAP